MEMDTKSWAITGIVAIVLIGLLWWAIAAQRASSPVVGTGSVATSTETVSDEAASPEEPAAPATAAKTGVSAVAAGETVSTVDQSAGTTAVIEQATLKKPSWIAIKDTTGRILGAGWFAGSGENLSVPLLRATEAGKVYQAVIYADDGDKRFDFKADALLTGVDGAPVSSTFRAQ